MIGTKTKFSNTWPSTNPPSGWRARTLVWSCNVNSNIRSCVSWNVNDTNDVVKKKIRSVERSISSLKVRKRKNRYMGYLWIVVMMLLIDANGNAALVVDCIDSYIPLADSPIALALLLEKAYWSISNTFKSNSFLVFQWYTNLGLAIACCRPNIQLSMTVSGPTNLKMMFCANGSPKQFESVDEAMMNWVDMLWACCNDGWRRKSPWEWE